METLGKNFTDEEFTKLERDAGDNGRFNFDKLYNFVLTPTS